MFALLITQSNMEYRDYYQILGVERTASGEEIKKAYRQLARLYHPDFNPADNAAISKFKEITEAYQVLSDPKRRRKYNSLGENYRRWREAGGSAANFNWASWFAPHWEELLHRNAFSEFFGRIFGSPSDLDNPAVLMRGNPAPVEPKPLRGADIERRVKITLEEAYSGTTRILQRGEVSKKVQIPPGVKTNSYVRVSGQGEAGKNGGEMGDLYLSIVIAPHEQFERRGADLYCTLTVDLYTALLGGEVETPILDRAVNFTLPPETQNGQILRLRGRGMPYLNSPEIYGDLYVTMQIELPRNLSERERELIRKLAELRDGAV